TGGFHTCVLKSGGTNTCWGSNTYGESTIPGSVSRIVAAGDDTCGLDQNAYVTCWGADLTGQLPRTAVFSGATPPYAGAGVYAFPAVATASRPVATYTLSAGSLPTGLTLNSSTGEIAGTATLEGDFPITIQAGNGITAAAAPQSLTVRVDLVAPAT